MENSRFAERKETVGCKWVFTLNVMLVVMMEDIKQNQLQKDSFKLIIDYWETFGSVDQINFIRVLLSLTANLD